jgi:hypothetical protein
MSNRLAPESSAMEPIRDVRAEESNMIVLPKVVRSESGADFSIAFHRVFEHWGVGCLCNQNAPGR